MSRRLAPLSLALLAGGCTVGPHYRVPMAAAPAQAPFLSQAPSLDPAGTLPARWWSLYRDPALDALVAEALQHNSDLRVAAANVERAQAVLSEARGGLFPTTQVSGGVTRARASANVAASTTGANTGSTSTGNTGLGGSGNAGGGGAGGTVAGGTTGGTTPGTSLGTVTTGSARTLYRFGGQLAYEVDLFGRVRQTITAARANLEATEATRDATRVTVAAATTQAYLDACTLGARIDVAVQSVGLVQQSYQITQRQYQLGAISEYEVSRIAVLLEQTRSQVPQLEALRASALFDLATFTGRTPNQLPAAAQQCHTLPRLPQALPVGDGAALLRRRPDVRAAERTLAADVARVDVATADLFPTITLGGSLTSAGTSVGNALSRSGTAFAFGPLISWFFPNIIATRARVQQASATARADLARFDGTVLTALGEAEKALSTYDAQLRQTATLAAAQQASRRALQLSAVRVQYGTISQLEQIDVQRDVIAAEAQLAAAQYALAQAQVAVFRTLGGGWQDAPPIDPAPRAVDGAGGLKLKPPQG